MKETEGAMHINKAKDEMKIRNSPRLFSEMVYYLLEEQKKWIFDHNTVSLRLKNKEVPIIEEDVYDVFGMPFGGESIMLEPVEKCKMRTNEWLQQFPVGTYSYVDKQLIRLPCDLDLYKYNWAEYLINYLVSAIEAWNRTSSTFFSGSLVFLMQFYVDRAQDSNVDNNNHDKGWNSWTTEKYQLGLDTWQQDYNHYNEDTEVPNVHEEDVQQMQDEHDTQG
ncbi:hypothetical protein POM88_044454 [Heracleum sosnowskyi]|uniref:Uncharacterized protein n=1 Tax=Heracleum sosnowskyi TaxID=360622 RepID=A0AAD8H5G1_9APIA|nr:hypothetical protein POM88_044454 [Heracleum sosnowskyi]